MPKDEQAQGRTDFGMNTPRRQVVCIIAPKKCYRGDKYFKLTLYHTIPTFNDPKE